MGRAPAPVIDHNERPPRRVISKRRPDREPVEEIGVIELEARLAPDVLGVDDDGDGGMFGYGQDAFGDGRDF